MFKTLSTIAIAFAVLAGPVAAAPDSAFIGPDGQIQEPLVLHRMEGTHRVTFVGACVVEFNAAYVVTSNNGDCTAERLAIAQEIVSLQAPAPYLTDIQVVRGRLPGNSRLQAPFRRNPARDSIDAPALRGRRVFVRRSPPGPAAGLWPAANRAILAAS